MEPLIANDNYSALPIWLALFCRETFTNRLMAQKPEVFTVHLNTVAEMVYVDVCHWWDHYYVQKKSPSTEICMQLVM